METTIQKTLICPVCASAATHQYRKDGFAIARCASCKTLFVENPPQDTSNLYNESYFFGGEAGGYGSYDEEKEAMRSTFEECLDRIVIEQPHGALFDVGAATGYFLALARKRGFTVSGIDISVAAAAQAQKKGITVETGTLETVPHVPRSFDVVTMFDVLEHVPVPGSLLKDVANIIKPGGVVMGCTPDSGSVYARLLGKRWHLLVPPEHLVLLNQGSLRLALKKEGFEVLWMGRIIKHFSPPYIFQIAARVLRAPWLARLGARLRGTWVGSLAIPLDVRDNVFFLARRF